MADLTANQEGKRNKPPKILTLDTDFAQIYHTLKKGTLSVIVIKANPATAFNILQTLITGSKKVDLQKTENKLIIISNKRIKIIT